MKKLLFLMLVSTIAFSQKKVGQAYVDSLLVVLPKMKNDTLRVNLLNDLSSEFQNFNNQDGIKYGKNAFNLSKKIKFKKGIATASKNIGINLSIQSKYEEANVYYDLALKNTTDKSLICDVYRTIAVDYTEQGNMNKSLEYNLKALTLAETLKDDNRQGSSLVNIGVIYSYLEKFDLAITYHFKALEKYKKTNNQQKIALASTYLADCYHNKNQIDKALDQYLISEKLIGNSGNIIFLEKILNSISGIYIQKNDLKKALDYTLKSFELNKKTQNKYNLSIEKTSLANIYSNLGSASNYKKQQNEYLNFAIINANEALKLKKEIGELTHISDLYRILSNIQQKQNKNSEALESYKSHIIYRDSVFNSDNKETVKNLEDKREIELRDNQIKINKLSLEANKKQKWLLFSGLGFLAIIGGLLFYQSRNRRKTNQKLQLLNENLDQTNKIKTRFFNILNHDLRSPVANLIDFLHIQKNTPDLFDEISKNRIQETTLTSAENLLVSMEDILLWSKGQMENFKPQPKNVAVNQLFDDTKKVFSGYLKINFDYQNPDNLEIFTDENYLKTIIRNLTSNAINVFTTIENPTIVWKAWKKNGKSYLSITDNGSGASQENFKALYDDTEVVGIKTGLGLHLIRDLAKAINCNISVDSKIGVGTTFVLKMK